MKKLIKKLPKNSQSQPTQGVGVFANFFTFSEEVISVFSNLPRQRAGVFDPDLKIKKLPKNSQSQPTQGAGVFDPDLKIKKLLEFCIINVDKPAGLTSFDVCEKIRRIFTAKKAGHTGTLDPMVTGVLPVMLNRACRLSNYFMKKDKEYIGKMYLHKNISEVELVKYMNEFIGKIMQKPPVRSRVKRVLRERIVNKFKIIKKDGRVVEFESDVQAGTYIRKLISDLGERIGGAHMTGLRRTRAGIFLEKDSHKLEEIEEAYSLYKQGKEEKLRKILLPAEIIQRVLTKLEVKDESLSKLLNGKPLMKQDLLKCKIANSELFSVFCRERFVGVYKKVDEGDIIAKPEFVMN